MAGVVLGVGFLSVLVVTVGSGRSGVVAGDPKGPGAGIGVPGRSGAVAGVPRGPRAGIDVRGRSGAIAGVL